MVLSGPSHALVDEVGGWVELLAGADLHAAARKGQGHLHKGDMTKLRPFPATYLGVPVLLWLACSQTQRVGPIV